MVGKDKATESVTAALAGAPVLGRDPWQHGDKPVIYIHSFYWDNMSTEQQASLKELADVFVVPEDVVPPVTPEA